MNFDKIVRPSRQADKSAMGAHCLSPGQGCSAPTGSTPTISQARQQEYYLAANVLKASQDKQTGAFVAGLGTPWGEINGNQDAGAYHLVWERDMYEFSSALIVAGDTADPKRAQQRRWHLRPALHRGHGLPRTGAPGHLSGELPVYHIVSCGRR